MAQFDAKSFNPQAFKYAVGRVPNLKMNEIIRSRALTGNPDFDAFTAQNGTAYMRLAIRGLADGEAVNYDGETDIPATSTKTYEQGVTVVGRAKGWVEKDFSYDVTGGIDFMDNIAQQVAEYKDGLDEDTLLATLEGVFSMATGEKNLEFVDKHTTEIDTPMTATTLNSAVNKACGAYKSNFSLVFMHSDVATNLENLNLLEHLKYTDANGIQRDLDLATWNGKLVVIDDDLPTETVDATDDAGAYTKYTTYVLGDGSIAYKDVGAKVEYEMDRDPAKFGGEDFLYMRQRKIFSPKYISYEKQNQASLSPTDAELKDGSNWSLVCSGETDEADRTYVNHKAIPLCRIISQG